MRRRTLAALVFAFGCSIAPLESRAEGGAIHAEMQRAIAVLQESKGPEAYAALRELWRTWDRGDPQHVEEAIAAYAENPKISAPLRVYAELLQAYARRRRGDLDGASMRIQKLGFVHQWLTLGPFENENKSGFLEAYAPEQEMGEPISETRAYDGKERAIKWRLPPQGAAFGWFDFGDLMRPRENICAYATTFVRSRDASQGPRKISLWMGASGAFKVFWNGDNVLEDSGYRSLDIDRSAAVQTLLPGNNRLTVKVCGTTDAPKFSMRIGDETGAPASDLVFEASFLASLAKAPASKEQKPSQKTSPKNTLLGPLQAFEKAVAGDKPDPRALEGFARYLFVTGGDSDTEHRGRDLARRAASAQPTVARCLLAGELAEDRNQQKEWVDKAAEKASPGDLNVLLAQARLAAGSVNFRDAVPIFQRILSIAPDHTGAILGLVDLYVEAGLSRMAMASLEKALAQNPYSVALLRAYAERLRTLGRDTDASEVEARYSALRFDDSSFLSSMVDLALVRRDTAGAERWLERFMRGESDSTWSRVVAARTYRALGQKDRALATYKEALAMAPEDTSTLRALSDLYGEEGRREEQLKLLRQILTLSPQEKEVREYVEHIEPPKPRADEAYAWAPERFLSLAKAPQKEGYPRQTLRDLNVTTVFENGLSSSFRQVVFQPLTDESAAQARQYPVSFQGDRQVVTLRAAKVYRGGSLTRVDEAVESGETGTGNPELAMYSSQRTFYVNFPRLSAGDVVELRLRVEDVAPRNEIADYYGEIEYMQSDEPLSNREYVLITPKNKTFHIFASPLPGLVKETKEEGEQRIFRFSAASVPPIGPEPAMPPWPSVLAQVHVSTFNTWDEVGAWYWGLSKEKLDVDDEVRAKVKEITKGLKSERDKIKAVYNYVTRLRYVALEFGIEGIRPRRCALTMARGWGDCKDKATVIVTMLRELGIPATLVLVRTGMRGDIESRPASLAPFDHAIAYVPSQDLYLDGTAEHTGTGELPLFDRGAFALQVNEGKPKLVRLPQPPAEQSNIKRKIEVALGGDGMGQVSVEADISGVYASDYRARYIAEGTRRERVTRDLSGEFGTLELVSGKGGLEMNNLDDTEQPVHWKIRGKAQSFARKEGQSFSIPAAPVMDLAQKYASLSTRKLDVVLGALTMREDEWTVKLAPGMQVTRVPLALSKDTPFGSFGMTVEQSAGKIVVKSRLVLKKAVIPPAEYDAWRIFCEAVDRAFGQRIVLSK